MQSGKSGRTPPSSSTPPQKKSPDPSTPPGAPMGPRMDLLPPELMLGGLRDWGRIILASGYLKEADRSVVEQAVKQLKSAEPGVLALLGKMSDAASARKLFEQIAAIAGAAYVISAHGAMTDTQDIFFKKSRAAHMRFRRSQSKRELAVRAAIKAEIEAAKGSLPSDHPYKDAGLNSEGCKRAAERSRIQGRHIA